MLLHNITVKFQSCAINNDYCFNTGKIKYWQYYWLDITGNVSQIKKNVLLLATFNNKALSKPTSLG
jgi:hypothetical protein